MALAPFEVHASCLGPNDYLFLSHVNTDSITADPSHGPTHLAL